jgi:hypothetical protein
MKYNIIQTDYYLLVVDDSEIKEIKEGDFLYSISNKLVVCANKGSADDINSKVMPEVIYKKIIAHLPLNDSPILKGIDLLPPLEDDVEKLAEEEYPKSDKKGFPLYMPTPIDLIMSRNSFKVGYNKAKEKFKYTEEDMRFIIMKSFLLGVDRAQYSKEREDEIIQSLSQSKMPTHFQVLYDIDTLLSEGKVYLMTTINSQGQTVWVGKYIY